MFKCILAFDYGEDYTGVKKELVLESPLTEPNSKHRNLIFGMYQGFRHKMAQNGCKVSN